MVKPILQVPNKTLYKVSEDVRVIDASILSLVEDMTYHLSRSRCIGLAAVQLGEKVRLIGIKRNIRSDEILFLINPVIVKKSDKTFPSTEGCESVNDTKTLYLVRRHKLVKVRALSLKSKEMTIKGSGIYGAILQHEIDHLNGITIDQHGVKQEEEV